MRYSLDQSPGVSRETKSAAREGKDRAVSIAKRTDRAHICAETTGVCQVDKNAKPNCQTVG